MCELLWICRCTEKETNSSYNKEEEEKKTGEKHAIDQKSNKSQRHLNVDSIVNVFCVLSRPL